MTHDSRTRFPRLAVAAVALAAAGLLAGSTAASAGVTPSPSPTETETVTPVPAPTPTHLSLRHLKAETFIIHSSTLEPGGDGVFTGPVRGASVGNFANGPDDESLTGPTGVVRLFHTPVGPLVIDWASCTASLHQTGRWALLGVSGSDRFSFGFGRYTLDEDAILARSHRGRCLGLRVDPLDVDVHVLGTGQAVNLRGPFIEPRLGPSLMPA
jgi:hypothetical protein